VKIREMTAEQYTRGWNNARVRLVLEYYEWVSF